MIKKLFFISDEKTNNPERYGQNTLSFQICIQYPGIGWPENLRCHVDYYNVFFNGFKSGLV